MKGIDRQHFTTHGQHLNSFSKKVLSSLIAEALDRNQEDKNIVNNIPLPSKQLECNTGCPKQSEMKQINNRTSTSDVPVECSAPRRQKIMNLMKTQAV